MAEDKVVIGSNEGTPVKPGDLTKITSVINQDSAEAESIATASIPRMRIKPNATSDSAETSAINKSKIREKLEEPKKKTTVKLKPVVVAETAEAVAMPSQASAAPRTAAAPAPMPAQATAVPKVVSEDETVKIHKPRPVIASPSVAAAPAVSSISSAPARPVIEDETVKIQKPHVGIASSAVPGVKQTIKLRPSSTTPAPISQTDSSTELPAPAPAIASPEPVPVAPPKSPVLAGSSEAKRTIRLVPKKSDATSGGDQASSAERQSSPTIRLEEPQEAPVPPELPLSRSAATIKLTSDSVADIGEGASSPKRTLKLMKPTKTPEATTVTPRPVPVAPTFSSPAIPAPVPMPTPTLMAKPSSPAVAAATDAEMTSSAVEETEIPPVIEQNVQEAQSVPSAYDIQEPSIIFTIAACIAFFVMAYFTWMLVGQYCNNYMDMKISVPGLSGKVK